MGASFQFSVSFNGCVKIWCHLSLTKRGIYSILIFDHIYFLYALFQFRVSEFRGGGGGHSISELSFTRASVGVRYTVRIREV